MQIDGTNGADNLDGTAGADVIRGFGGTDQINGGAGDDVIDGGADYDSIYGGAGSDTIDGGDGNDYIFDEIGSDTLRGGAGNDQISVYRHTVSTAAETLVIEGGIGNDMVGLTNSRLGSTSVDLGSGDDILDLGDIRNGTARLTLGAGRDEIRFWSYSDLSGGVAVTDFVAGDLGDVFVLDQFLSNSLVGWDPSSNPFGASGHLRLVQVGSSVALQVDRDGTGTRYAATTLMTLENSTANLFTATNFDGLAPDGSAVVGRTITGTEGDDKLTGTAAGDTISGLNGFDQIDGKAGDDTIIGGGGRDTLQGGLGDDLLDGGDADDQIFDHNGSDTLRGGAGNDQISSFRSSEGAEEEVTIEGGAGNDDVFFGTRRAGASSIDLGAGDDLVSIASVENGSVSVTLGLGRDTVAMYFGDRSGEVTLTDFDTAAGGDLLVLDEHLNNALYDWDYSSNPFGAAGYLRLLQVGSDVVLQVDRDGTGSDDFDAEALLTFADMTLARFSGAELSGFRTDGSAVVGRTINGTGGDDTLTGTVGDDVISGYDGYDVIDGKAGDDVINGGGFYDYIVSGLGDDVVDGGDGNDSINDVGGSDTLRGGAGDDRITISRYGSEAVETIVIEGGSGNDHLEFATVAAGSTAIDLGDGDDEFFLSQASAGAVSATLGAGRDRVTLSSWGDLGGGVTLTDFAAGAAGDRLAMAAFLSGRLIGWDNSSNPFQTGHLRLASFGTNTVLQVDRDASGAAHGFATLLSFANVTASALTADNFGGYAPVAVDAAAAVTAVISAPASLIEGNDPVGALSVTFRNASNVSGTAYVSFVAGQSSASNGADVSLAETQATFALSRANVGDLLLTLPPIGILDDLAPEGVETVTVRVRVSGQTFDTGTDTKLITISIGDNDVVGTANADSLAGTSGRDMLDGGLGADTMAGGAGDDAYHVDQVGDVVIEAADGGADRVNAAASWVLGAGQAVEVLSTDSPAGIGAISLKGNEFAQTIIGNAGANVLNGEGGADVLIGLAGADVLIGGAGAANTLQGGLGDDTYQVSLAGDSVIEFAGEGVDLIRTDLSTYVLGSHVERLLFTGAGAFTGLGNALDNLILGGAGDDLLNGFEGADFLSGGAGRDVLLGGAGQANTLVGGAGDDTYHVAVAGDSVVEYAGEGIDLIRTELGTYVLGTEIEQLIFGGAGAFTGLGNALDNTLIGGAGDDLLNGFEGADFLSGGAGRDVLLGGAGQANTLVGGTGDDTYYVSVAGDSVVEGAGGGYDTVATDLASYTLSGAVEALRYVGAGSFTGFGRLEDDVVAGGGRADTLYGLAGADVLIGAEGADYLFGGDGGDQLFGGAGRDRLEGGAGGDLFALGNAPGANDADVIADFQVGSDKLLLDRKAFAGLAAGALPAGAFARGDVATEADDRILYNPDTGALLFDPDGAGGAAAIIFATISVVSGGLSAADFMIV